MKDSVTRFNFDDAFKALDEIEIPVAEKGIRANRVDLKESMKRVDKFELLFEDFYDVNNADDMNTVSEEREAEVAKAKLARIEKIVDLDAETEDDILPSYVGKTIIQCPQCMTLFYKNAEDIVRDEENPDVVNVNEVCQHCGNESGYEVVGKVAEETEATPGDELGTDDFSAEVGDGENGIAIDNGSETTEEVPAEESGEVDELSAEADLDSLDLDLDTELDLEEEPVEEEEEANESLNTSKLLKKIEDKNELKTEYGSEKLTLNEENKKVVSKETDQVCSVIENGKEDYEYFTGTEEECKAWIEDQNKTEAGKLRKWSVKKSAHVAMVESIEDNLDDKLKAHEEYIKELRDTISELEKKLAGTKNEQIKTSIQSRIDATRAELEAALPEAVKVEAETEELPDATEAGMEDATDNTSDETEVIEDETEETTESLHEAVESMTDTLNRAWEVAKKTNSPIGVTVVTPVGAGTNSKIKEWSKTVNANLYYVSAKNTDLMANGFDENMISRPDTIIVLDEFDRAPADTQKAISNEIDNLDTQVEMIIAISHDSNINGDNFKRFKQYVATVEKEETTESLTEAVSMTSSPENFKALLNTQEFKEPISQEEVESFFESVDADLEAAEVTVEGDTDPVELDDKNSTLTEGPLASRAAKKAKAEAETRIDNIITMMVANKFKYLYILPFINSNTVARYLSTQPGLFDASASYTQTNKRFLATTNNSQDFPLFVAQIDPSEDKEKIKAAVTAKLSNIAEQLQNISKTKAYEFADIIGGTKINPVGKHYELADNKAMPFDNVDLVGVKNPIPDISEGMAAGEAKIFTERVPKSLTWLMRVNSTGSILVNNEALNATTGSTVADPIEDPSYKAALEKRISQFANVASINTTDDGATFTVVDIQARDKYLALRNVCIENSDTTGTPFYIIGLVDELKDISKGKSEIINIDVIKNLAIEQFIDGQPKKVSSFTGKLPEKTEDKKEEPKEAETDKEPEEASSDISSNEPSTPEERKPYLEKILAATGKKYLGVILHKDSKSFATKYVATGGVPYAKTTAFEKILTKLPTVQYMGVPMDTAIILVDDATYEVGKIVKGKTLNETDFLAKCPAGGKVTTNLKKIADALKITFDEPDTDDDDAEITDESFKVSDIDEKSFNEALTESLTNVYENVNNFTMTDCSLASNKLVVEGLITFNSGKVKTTSYIFEAHKAPKTKLITLSGINKDLFESGELKLDTKTLNETLYAGSLSYKYAIGEKIVEGLIRSK